jgi:Protein of unknown function (DUF3099)
MKQQQTSITSLPPSPADERKARMIKYSITTGIRMVCIVLAVVVHGWISIPFIIGAIVLPYFAVIGANVSSSAGVDVIAPDDRALQRYVPAGPAAGESFPGSFPTGPDAWTNADDAWRAEQAAAAENAARDTAGAAPGSTDGTDRP